MIRNERSSEKLKLSYLKSYLILLLIYHVMKLFSQTKPIFLLCIIHSNLNSVCSILIRIFRQRALLLSASLVVHLSVYGNGFNLKSFLHINFTKLIQIMSFRLAVHRYTFKSISIINYSEACAEILKQRCH